MWALSGFNDAPLCLWTIMAHSQISVGRSCRGRALEGQGPVPHQRTPPPTHTNTNTTGVISPQSPPPPSPQSDVFSPSIFVLTPLEPSAWSELLISCDLCGRVKTKSHGGADGAKSAAAFVWSAAAFRVAFVPVPVGVILAERRISANTSPWRAFVRRTGAAFLFHPFCCFFFFR